MTPERWQQIKEVLYGALEHAPEQRPAFLDQACSRDHSLRQEVESLLASSDEARSGFLQSFAMRVTLTKGTRLGDYEVQSLVGSASIGPYRLVKKLGEGGMGQVWLAEQTEPLRRQVALKLIKVGMYDDSVLQRFQSERQSLAIMEHPSIAKVFDAGATTDGQPYFVMEYVPGLPITDYCDQKRLTIRERLELFIKVCEGVQHAHQKAIMHRDLKPANILVVEIDGKPVPRIIDFGLAKAATPQLDGATFCTQVGGWVGTPGYMSPEQADPRVVDVDTRTDVYSLGAVLYVLLTGFLPFETRDWRKQRFDQFLQRLREEDPPRPSTKIGVEKEYSKKPAEVRGLDSKQLGNLLNGDLDWITMKALERDRTRRYGTPAELAADIARHLHHEPVVARPASSSYRLRKYVRRHRMGVAVASGLVLLLAGFAVMQAVQLRRITRERDRANRITEFMTSMFKVSDPTEARGNSITAREILDKASNDIDTGLAKDPELQAQMMHIMGGVYHDLGLYPQAERLLRRALEIQRRVLGPQNLATLTSMGDLAFTLRSEGRYPEAEKFQRETLEGKRRVLGPKHPDTLQSLATLGMIVAEEGRYAEAERLFRELLDIRRRVLGVEHPRTVNSMTHLVNVWAAQGRYPEAEKFEREALDIVLRLRTKHGANDLEIETSSGMAMDSLAGILRSEGRYAEAEKLQREAIGIWRKVLGPEGPDTLRETNDLAVTLTAEGKYTEAEQLQRDVLKIQSRLHGPENPNTLDSTNELARTLQREGNYAEAERLQRNTFDIQRRVLGPEHPETLNTMSNFAVTLDEEGNYAEAERLERESLESRRRVLGPENPDAADSTYKLACIEARHHQLEEALSLLQEAIDHGLAPNADLWIETDPDLKSLHGDPRFDALVAHAKERAAAAQKTH